MPRPSDDPRELDTWFFKPRLNESDARSPRRRTWITAPRHRATGTNSTHTGLGTCATVPVGASLPDSASILNTTTVSDPWFAASRNVPVGSIAKLRGVLPWVLW